MFMVKSEKCDFIKDQLKANIAKPSKLWEVLKSLGLSSKGSTNAKVCLKKNEIAHFEPKETSGIFRIFLKTLLSHWLKSYQLHPRYLQWRQPKNIMMNLIFRTV